jgi:hypothetical protein
MAERERIVAVALLTSSGLEGIGNGLRWSCSRALEGYGAAGVLGGGQKGRSGTYPIDWG